MTRICTLIATIIFATMTFFAPSAKACISCEYTPPVVSAPYEAKKKSYSHKRKYRKRKARRHRSRSRTRKAKTHRPSKSRKAKVEEKKKSVEEETETAAAEEPVKEEPKKRKTGPATATAALERGETLGTAEAAKKKDLGCKRFSPTIGASVSVPCD